MAFVYAISSQKGGVAKTTTCLSLGAGLAELDQRVLVVDLDSQADLTIATGLDPDRIDNTIVDLLITYLRKQQHNKGFPIYQTAVNGLHVLPADVRLAGLERKLYNIRGYEHLLSYILRQMEKPYNCIILDCPPSLGALTLMALSAADTVLIPAQCEFYAARGLERLLDIAEMIRDKTNPGLTTRVLPVMFDQRNQISRIILQKMRAAFPEEMVESLIAVDTTLREAPVLGEPITEYASESRAAAQYRALAKELLELQAESRKGL